MGKTVRIEQHWVEPSNPDRLNETELYVLVYLLEHMNYHGEYTTSIEVLGELVPIVKDIYKNRKHIDNALVTLQEKGLIDIEEFSKRVFKLTFHIDKSQHYDILPREVLEKANVEEFAMFSFIYRHQKHNKTCRLSFSKIRTLTGTTNGTVQRIVKRLEELGALEKDSGSYVERGKQADNQYYLNPQYFGIQEWNYEHPQHCVRLAESHTEPQEKLPKPNTPQESSKGSKIPEKRALLRDPKNGGAFYEDVALKEYKQKQEKKKAHSDKQKEPSKEENENAEKTEKALDRITARVTDIKNGLQLADYIDIPLEEAEAILPWLKGEAKRLNTTIREQADFYKKVKKGEVV
ncbi:helix-turn-helix domain-containing protein [Thalassobacillus sp. CUG 92003]|uniref:MarR family transcriptional regulator n=1 Tax=Thalassobacillus sp. CUG 92003 TaxID=2736641 RepID=UPI0015E6AA9A|nr:helix-turn-helix domain-containing protein [Thalassobacillus sp. CUG 92003]